MASEDKSVRKIPRVGTESNRGRDGKATGFKQVQTIRFFIDRFEIDKYRAIAALCYYTAARVNAVCHLRAKDLRGGMVHFVGRTAKTKKAHAVPMADELKAYLADCDLPEHGYLFPPNGKIPNRDRLIYSTAPGENKGTTKTVVKGKAIRPCLSTQAFNDALSRVRAGICENPSPSVLEQLRELPELAGLKTPSEAFYGFSSHSFRRSMCMHLFYEQGWPAPKVMAISGHKSLDSFYQYIGYHAEAAQADFTKLFAMGD